MKQQNVQKWEHLPNAIQEARNPVKKVQKSLQQPSSRKYTAEDLLGLSWTIFEEKY